MIVGDLLLRMNSDPYYGPPMARSTCHAIFSVQVTNTTGTASFLIQIEHKNRDDTSWSVVGGFASITLDGTYSADVAGIKELWRYKYTPNGGLAKDGMYIYSAPPQWLND